MDSKLVVYQREREERKKEKERKKERERGRRWGDRQTDRRQTGDRQQTAAVYLSTAIL